MFTKMRGVLYATGFVLLWSWIAISLRPIDERLAVSIPSSLRPVGFLVAACGAILAGTCLWLFVTRGRGTPAPFDPPREFVAVGPYRYVRNPMYIGGLSVILGFGLVVGSVSIVALSVIFLLLAHLFVLLYEERTLERRFGSSYLEYKQSVNRWLPQRPRKPLAAQPTR